MKITGVLLFTLLLVNGCASTTTGYGYSGVIIDEYGVDMEQFRVDLAECEQYASAVDKSGRAVGSAAEGAMVGGAIGAIFNGVEGAARGAGTGAVLSGARGAKSADYEKRRVVRTCLRYRGYRVLN